MECSVGVVRSPGSEALACHGSLAVECACTAASGGVRRGASPCIVERAKPGDASRGSAVRFVWKDLGWWHASSTVALGLESRASQACWTGRGCSLVKQVRATRVGSGYLWWAATCRGERERRGVGRAGWGRKMRGLGSRKVFTIFLSFGNLGIPNSNLIQNFQLNSRRRNNEKCEEII